MSGTEGDDAASNREGLLIEDPSPLGSTDRTRTLLQTRQIAQFGALKAYFRSHEGLELMFSMVLLGSAVISECVYLDPRQRSIPYQQLESTGEYIVNQVYNESFEGETVSSVELFLYGAIIPFLVQITLSFQLGANDLHRTACVYCTAIGLTSLLTNSAKLYVGYLRPLFYDLCAPDDAYEYCTSGEDSGARKSFPSGHSSISFCGLGLLSFYLEWRFGVSSLRTWNQDSVTGDLVLIQRRSIGLERIKSIFCFVPIVVAGFIAASRIVDNKHFPADVVGGSILGATIAKLIHSIWFD